MTNLKIYFLLPFVLLLCNNQTTAQDFTITVENITESVFEQAGQNFIGIFAGAINFDINENFFLEGHTLDIIAEGPCLQFDQQIFESQSYPIEAEEKCSGQYCFKLIKNRNTDAECAVKTCVIVEYCRTYQIVNGRPRAIKEPICRSPFRPDDTEDTLSKVETNQQTNPTALKNSNAASTITINEVYPNPFSSSLKINMFAKQSGNVTASLINTLGKVILSRSLNVDEGSNLLALDIEQKMPFGSYFLVVTDELGNRHFHQVIHAAN